MKNRYLTETEVNEMALAALASYEFNCNWSQSWWSAKEHCQDEFNVSPSKSVVSLAVNKAKAMWEANVQSTKVMLNGGGL